MRLDYFVAHATGLTRKQVKTLIRSGAIQVFDGAGGAVPVKPDRRLETDMRVVWEGRPLRLEGHRYLMLHKPMGVVCSTEDPGHRTVLDLLPGDQRAGLHAAGRLDLDTTGLVLLTSDGQWSHRITSPQHHCAKRYRVTTAEPVTRAQVDALSAGVVLRDDSRPTREAQVEVVAPLCLRLTISEGRYHQVKRMLAAVGNRVVALHREAVGDVVLDPALTPGEWRPLTDAERHRLGPPD
ncbi:pseudouridylate synthase [Alcanivorax xiamenensis]|uniref:Pseudouridine synthase n=2 Tax=Alcanivorax TaxID=59753 RepID=A0ABQ6Y223_9GAMM|nr:16S rRNA pseudouridine(516) synthase [Alcanivorax xiamenensis]KAF0801745.1 pseudouridylate synthase [Alcanivorax xiamenensis]